MDLRPLPSKSVGSFCLADVRWPTAKNRLQLDVHGRLCVRPIVSLSKIRLASYVEGGGWVRSHLVWSLASLETVLAGDHRSGLSRSAGSLMNQNPVGDVFLSVVSRLDQHISATGSVIASINFTGQKVT